MKLDIGKLGKKVKGAVSRDRVKEDHAEKEASSKQAEPTRIKIFEGGYVKICALLCVKIQPQAHGFCLAPYFEV